MKKFISIFILAVIALVVWISVRDHLRYHPAKNPQPKYFLTVKGHVDPKLKNDLKLEWGTSYATTNPKCNKTYNWLEGVSGERIENLNYAVTFSSNGDYQLRIPIDGLIPGYCGWEVGDVYFSFKYKKFDYSADADTAFGLSKTGEAHHKKIKQTWRCDNEKCILSKSSDADLTYNLSLLSNHNLIVNFKK